MEYKYLNNINSPDDVKKLNNNETNILCEEIRDCIINTVSKNGGHLASNLGSVELTVAVHKAFSSPDDAIIFDVGHQCYAHKLITGRFDRFSSIRKFGGLSGYMRPDESEHDPFITGHSSNSISAAYGIYKAKCLLGEKGTAVAVIGDGAMTGGMAYEALNNVGNAKGNFIVILNDNKMSISRNVGSMARNLTKMRNRPRYHHFKFKLSQFLKHIPLIGKPLNQFVFSVKEAVKGLVYKNNLFTSLGMNYLGPVDGHDVKAMEQLFNVAKTYTRPSLIHVVTTKGKGYSYAESSPKSYHGVSPFDIELGACESFKQTFSSVAGDTLCSLASSDEKICAITAAMTSGTGLTNFARDFRTRFFDVGIAEQHAVTFSCGLAKGGMKPYFVVYSSFLQRGFDQIIHDASIANLPVRFLIDRAGIVGEDGETHQGLFDVSFLTEIPNITVYSPSFFSELEMLIKRSAREDKLIAIRYPRGCEKEMPKLDFSSDFTLISNNSMGIIVTYGRIFSNVFEAYKEEKNIDVLKLNKIYPIEEKVINTLMKYEKIYFFEEGIKSGGIGEHISSLLLENNYKGKFFLHAIDNKYVPQGTVSEIIEKMGLDTESIIKEINSK